MGNQSSNTKTSKNSPYIRHTTPKQTVTKNSQLLYKLNHLNTEQITNLRPEQKHKIIDWLSKNKLQLRNQMLQQTLFQKKTKINTHKKNPYELHNPSHSSSYNNSQYHPSQFQKSKKISQIPNSRLADMNRDTTYQSRMRPNISLKEESNTQSAYKQELQQRRTNVTKKYNPRTQLPEIRHKQHPQSLENQYQQKYQQRTSSNNQNYLNTIHNLGIDVQKKKQMESKEQTYNFMKQHNRIKQSQNNPKSKSYQNGRAESKNRRAQFESELNSFSDSGFDATQILGLQSNFSLNELKKAYRRAAIKTHPDRPGGNEEQFEIVTKAYMFLIEKIKREAKDKQYDELKQDYQEFEDDREQRINIDLSKKFNLDSFNKIYSKNKINEPTDTGYGDIMEAKKVREDIDIPNVFSKKFNVNVFNTAFEDLKEEDNNNMQMIKIDNPAPVNSSNKIHYSELGQGKINDFGSGANIYNGNSLQYTDYKRAHVTQTKLINTKNVETTEYRNVKELEAARSNISYDMNEEDRLKQAQRKEMQKQQEIERKRRLFQRDQNIQDQYHKINQLTLGRN